MCFIVCILVDYFAVVSCLGQHRVLERTLWQPGGIGGQEEEKTGKECQIA